MNHKIDDPIPNSGIAAELAGGQIQSMTKLSEFLDRKPDLMASIVYNTTSTQQTRNKKYPTTVF
jgi:hypothetical protein